MRRVFALLLVAAPVFADEPASPPAEDELQKAMREAESAFAAASVPAGPPVGLPTAPQKGSLEVNGYVSNRLSFSWNDTSGLIPVIDQPELQDLLELNVQLRKPLWANAFAYVDASAFALASGVYVTKSPSGARVYAPNHDVPAFRPAFILSEGYLSWSPQANLNFLVGRKRIVWGAGLAYNPTDVLNPPKDPTDPNLQRAGAWVARVEAPFERVTLTLLWSPAVLYQESGLPYQFLDYPNYPPAGVTAGSAADPRDKSLHYILGARWYVLLFDSDVNFIYYFSNLYGDGFHNHSRLGGSFSRYFFTDYELHVEGLVEEGARRIYVNAACAESLAAAAGCLGAQTPLYGNFALDDGHLYGRVIVGTRRVFSEESQLSIEYLFVGDGLTPGQFQAYARGLVLAAQAGFTVSNAGSGASTGGLINRFTLDPLRRHYLFINYSKPHVADDWTFGAVIIAGLEDLSGLIVPSITWNTREWLNLELTGFIPIRGVGLGANVNGHIYPEYGFVPFDWRVLLEARFFY